MTIKNAQLLPAGSRLLPRPARDAAQTEVSQAGVAAAVLSLAVAMIHLWTAPGYFEVWWGYGTFFLGVAAAQGLFSVGLLRWPGRVLSLAGIFGNLSVIMVYVLSRTSGVPFGPHAGRAEDAGLLDMSATGIELMIVVFLLTLLDGRGRSVAINAVLLAGAGIWALRLAGFLS
ncbi:hypothetical protein [Rubrobacter tropicus]|uniref:hypothetical protein n=1 Tax=Rubrobacter tropicus TaxID=2653851 RepID=UPI00140B2735|nr:hypothetical protein [Rubrobacter tropicus]